MKDKVLVFGGTTEGRLLSEALRGAGIPHVVSVATEYGFQILKDSGEDSVVHGRKDADQIAELIRGEGFLTVVDSTHPFATEVSKEIRKACEATGAEYIRLRRDTDAGVTATGDILYVEDLESAVAELEKAEGNILLLTGSRDLQKITEGLSDVSRVYARVLPDGESLKKCENAGLKGRQIIAMQGPFSTGMNEALIRETKAGVILTKESGKTGGLDEKLEAAENCGIKAVVLKNPERQEIGESEKAYSLAEVVERLTGEAYEERGAEAESSKPIIVLAGIGPGNPDCFTRELDRALVAADVIFGASSVIGGFAGKGTLVPKYLGEEILGYLKENPWMKHPLVLFSGDVSLCSGAKKAAKIFEEAGYKVKILSGISSVNLFAKKLGIGLEDMKILSAHGRTCNIRGYAARNEHTVILPSNCKHAVEICVGLKDQADRIVIGYELGNPEERILCCEAGAPVVQSGSTETGQSERGELPELSELADLTGRCLIYVHNAEAAGFALGAGLRDEEILRGDVPMTKEEIRALSMRKLSLTGNAVFYDIGAGTGSVSLEAALLAPEIKAYSVEKKEAALELLRKNKEYFHAENMEIIGGSAPEVLQDLPAPTHAFVGGSSGNLKEILLTVFEKNEKARVVVNAVTAETFQETMNYLEEHPEIGSDVIQVFVSRYKEVGRYHMADAINPVYIITLEKCSK
ncbi:MAG: precorrin-6A reductase [Lachnospiraceae bacterium]|nr:precorrin-6A reductase [Lachnospiraceae bacterium]